MGAVRRKTTTPVAAEFAGPDRTYRVKFAADGDWGGLLRVEFDDEVQWWPVDLIEEDSEGRIAFSGFADPLDRWGDTYWFVLEPHALPKLIKYWGDRVIMRVDKPV